MGACFINRNNGVLNIRRGALLFFGKYNSIKELYPYYHLDYFNRRGDNQRYIDRISDDEPNGYEMNIFNFYNIVSEKLKALLKESFRLDDTQQIRLPISNFDASIREALVNSLAHADYTQGYPSTKIEVFDGWFRFVNPGKMLVTPRQFVTGGDSRPRNEFIMKFFRWLGASERQGFGGQQIFRSALENKFRNPEIETDIEHTELRIWNIDLADSYPELNINEKSILRIIMKADEALSIKVLREKVKTSNLKITDYALRKALNILNDKKLIHSIGNGPSTKYELRFDSKEKFFQMQMQLENIRKLIVKS